MTPPEAPLTTAEIRVSVGQVVGLLEAVDEASGTEDAAQVARDGKLHADLIPEIIRVAEKFGLVDVDDGDIILKDQGRRVLDASINDRKRVFAEVLNHQDWIQETFRVLDVRGGKASRAEVTEALAAKFGPFQADSLFAAAAYWGRYAAILKYNSRTEILSRP